MWHRDPLTHLVHANDPSFWQTVWKSPQFQKLLKDPTDPYQKIIAWAAAQPWWFVPLRQAYEKYHFGTWFGQTLGQRTYENPLIHDLYLFHEVLHAATFEDMPASTDQEWEARMRANEIMVSLETEVLVYARHPEWRSASFDQPIWADHFDLSPGPLTTTPWQAVGVEQRLWTHRPGWPLPFFPTQSFGDLARLWVRRRQAALHPDPQDASETLIAQYEDQATLFFDSWRPYWRQVERDRIVFSHRGARGDWDGAIAQRLTRWDEVSNADGVPYGDVGLASFVA